MNWKHKLDYHISGRSDHSIRKLSNWLTVRRFRDEIHRRYGLKNVTCKCAWMSYKELSLHLGEEYVDEFIHEVNNRCKTHRQTMENRYRFGCGFEDRAAIRERIIPIVYHFSSTRGLRIFLQWPTIKRSWISWRKISNAHFLLQRGRRPWGGLQSM